MRFGILGAMSFTSLLILVACDSRTTTSNLPEVISPSRPWTLSTQPVPTTLTQALDALSRGLSGAQVHALQQANERDAVRIGSSEHDVGPWIQSHWGLPANDLLFGELSRLGLRDPNDISDAVLTSFWRRLHAQRQDLVAQLQLAHETRKADRETREADRRRMVDFEERRRHEIDQQEARIRSMVMGITLAVARVPRITLARRATSGLKARYLAPFRGGVMLAVRSFAQLTSEYPAFRLEPYFFATGTKTLRPVHVPELDLIWSTVVAGHDAWFAGEAKGLPRLLRVGTTHTVVPLPVSDAIPQLGLEGEAVLAVYQNIVFRFDLDRWTRVYAGGTLPTSGPPPRVRQSRIYLREEGRYENGKRLWWTDLSGNAKLVSHDADIGIGWEDAPSYAFDGSDLWLTAGNSAFGSWSLVRRTATGQYRLAIVNGSVGYRRRLSDEPPDVSISALAMEDGRLIGAGNTGLYQVTPTNITAFVRFANTTQVTKDNTSWTWDPSDLLRLGQGRHLIAGLFGGIYLLEPDGAGAYSLISLDEQVGKPLTF